MHVAIVIHHHDVFGEHHLPHSPEPVHDLERLPRVLFTDGDEDQVVEDTLCRERDINDLGKVHLEHGQEDLDARAAHVEVLHWR